jgi:hypothetical protein
VAIWAQLTSESGIPKQHGVRIYPVGPALRLYNRPH